MTMADSSGSVSVGHGPGAGGNEGTAPDRSTGATGSNLTADEKDVPGQTQPDPTAGGSPAKPEDATAGLMNGTRRGPAQPASPT